MRSVTLDLDAGRSTAAHPRDPGRRSSLYLTMRDGVRIALDVHLPSRLGPAGRVPAILRQTRYFRSVELPRAIDVRAARDMFDLVAPTRERFLARGYAWVDVDVRGSGVSSGSWPLPWSPDEVRDGEAIVDWIVRQPWSSGRVGSTGISYEGTTADMLASTCHPAVRAIAPRFSLFDAYEDVAFPGGVHLAWFTEGWSTFNRLLDDHRFHEAMAGLVDVIARARALEPGAPLAPLARGLLDAVGPRRSQAAIAALFGLFFRGGRRVDEDPDGRERARCLLDHVSNGDVHDLCSVGTFRDDPVPGRPALGFRTVSPRDAAARMRASGAAVLSIGGWLDGAYPRSAARRFRSIGGASSRLVLGPWGHGGALAHEPFGRARPATFDHDAALLRFFDRHLLDREGDASDAPVRFFVLGEGWRSAESWPPPEAEASELFVRAGRTLSPEPAETAGADEVRVAADHGTGERSRWRGMLATFVPADYPDLAARHRTLVAFDADPVDRDVVLVGHPVVTLVVRASATDATVFAYLEDVAPDGRVGYVTEGQLRAIHRAVVPAEEGFTSLVPHHSFLRGDAAPLEPGSAAELSIGLLPVAYRLRRGHRLRLVVTTGDRDHFGAAPEATAPFEVLHGPEHRSRLELAVLRG